MSFVKRADDRLWGYCLRRFRQRWAGHDKRVPTYFGDDGMGWWFPKLWIQDFLDTHGNTFRTPHRPHDLERRASQVEAAMRDIGRREAAE